MESDDEDDNEGPLQDAKNRFSAVVDAAIAGEPQRMTRHSKPAVVVLAVEEYERLCHLEKAKAPTFADMLIAMLQDDEDFEPPCPANPTLQEILHEHISRSLRATYR